MFYKKKDGEMLNYYCIEYCESFVGIFSRESLKMNAGVGA